MQYRDVSRNKDLSRTRAAVIAAIKEIPKSDLADVVRGAGWDMSAAKAAKGKPTRKSDPNSLNFVLVDLRDEHSKKAGNNAGKGTKTLIDQIKENPSWVGAASIGEPDIIIALDRVQKVIEPHMGDDGAVPQIVATYLAGVMDHEGGHAMGGRHRTTPFETPPRQPIFGIMSEFGVTIGEPHGGFSESSIMQITNELRSRESK